MTYLGILIIAGALAGLEVPALLRQKEYRMLAAVLAILALGTAYAIGQAMKLPLPSISQIMQWLARPFGQAGA